MQRRRKMETLEIGEKTMNATELRLRNLVRDVCKLRAASPRREQAIADIEQQIDRTRRVLFGASDARRIVALLAAADALYPPQEAA
jgi:hypothetical protein